MRWPRLIYICGEAGSSKFVRQRKIDFTAMTSADIDATFTIARDIILRTYDNFLGALEKIIHGRHHRTHLIPRNSRTMSQYY